MESLDHFKAFTIEKYIAGGGKSKRFIKKIAECTSMKELLRIRRTLKMVEWNNQKSDF